MDPDKPSTSSKEESSKRTSNETEVEAKVDKQEELDDLKLPINFLDPAVAKRFLERSDEELLDSLKNENRKDVKKFKSWCEKILTLTLNTSFWTLDYRKEPMLPSQMLPYENFFEPVTHCLAIRGDLERENDNCLRQCFFNKLQQICRQLKKLIIEEYYINVNEVTIREFPPTIEKLELNNCTVYSNPACSQSSSKFFHQISDFVPNIKCLILNNGLWYISPSVLRDIGKLPHLKELRITSCSILDSAEFDRDSPMCNFTTLEILDLQNTIVNDTVIEWLCQIKSLKQLYLECPKYLRREWSNESLEDLNKLKSKGSKGSTSMCMFDEKLIEFLSNVEFYSLSGGNNGEEIINFRNDLFQDYFMSNISKYMSNCNNLETLCIRHYSHVTETDIDLLASTLPNLKKLDITGCSITIEDVTHFHSQRPNVKVIWY